MAGTTRNPATSSVKISWPVKIRRSRMVLSSRRHGATAERGGNRKDSPRYDPKFNRQGGRCRKIRGKSELGIDQHRQHIYVGRQRERRAERTHRGRKGNSAGGNEGRSERRQNNIALHGPGAGAERARGFFRADVKLLDCGHDRENDARDRKIEISQEKSVDRIGEDQLLAKHAVCEIADQALAPSE